jgi:general secretion pathway protein A
MFLEYYGLTEEPFGVTPHPRFLYLGSQHREALAALDYGTRTNRGFMTLIAKPGMGKTSLLFQYLESVREKARTVFLFQTDGDALDLMHYILADLGLDGTGKNLPEMRSLLNEVLLEEMGAGRRFILVIDEAQNLNEKALESIRLLSNFETPRMKLMQIVLAGQPQLADQLTKPSMAQLRQRISLSIKIEPFTFEETDAYIDHRLTVAGYKGPQLFTVGARRLITEQSEGTPRIINNICFGAMSLGWALKRKTIDHDLVLDILADLGHCPRATSLEEKTAVVLKLPEEAKPRRREILHPIEDRSPFSGWLPRIAVAGAILLALVWFCACLYSAETPGPTTSFKTLTTAPVFRDSKVCPVSEINSGGSRAEASSSKGTSRKSPPIGGPVAGHKSWRFD